MKIVRSIVDNAASLQQRLYNMGAALRVLHANTNLLQRRCRQRLGFPSRLQNLTRAWLQPVSYLMPPMLKRQNRLDS